MSNKIDLSKDNDYRLAERIKADEQELAELEKQRQNAINPPQPDNENTEDDTPPPAVDPKEKTFEKRYGDLRRHFNETVANYKKEIENLKREIEGVKNSSQSQLPATEEQLNAWMKEYPHLAKIFETIVLKKLNMKDEEIKRVDTELKRMQRESAKARAYNEVLKKHPDLPEIVNSVEYNTWLEEQPQIIVDSLIHNETDAKAAIRALDLFKHDTGWGKKKPKNTDRDASQNTGRSSVPEVKDNDKKVIRESEVEAMSDYEYAKRSDEINLAIQEGRFIYDISGGAR